MINSFPCVVSMQFLVNMIVTFLLDCMTKRLLCSFSLQPSTTCLTKHAHLLCLCYVIPFPNEKFQTSKLKKFTDDNSIID